MFWEQTVPTYNAAMAGALRARKAEAEQRRDLALMTAYFGGQLANADFKKMPPFVKWLADLTTPKRKASSAEVIAFFRSLSAANTPN